MAIAREADEKTVTLTINGREVKAAPGDTILRAARSAGVRIPTLCHDERLEPYGACRMCLVEVEGARGAMPACATKVNDGMVIETDTEKIHKLRKFVLELLLSNHPLDCPVCEAAGDCRLQDYAYQYEVNMSPWGWTPLEFESRDDHPNVARNPNRCILCGRCVRICRDVMGIGCWGFTNRGYDTIIDTPYNLPLQDVGCVSCGQCISTCPVGALNMKRSRYAARHWQTEKTATICSYCGVGCEIIAHTFRNKLVRVTSRVGRGVNDGNLCVKGRFGHDYVNSPDRLTVPLVRDEQGSLVPSTWEVALDRIEESFTRVKAESGRHGFAVLASAKCTNEENYLIQKFARGVLGTNNVDHCARL
jgi:NADH dehydrogenase/NADH:ubiquinone oxidoreductase subunit G